MATQTTAEQAAREAKTQDKCLPEDKTRLVAGKVRLKAVDSSNIAAVGFLPCENGLGTLYVEFKTGAVYGYADVPADTHQALLAAASCGQYFAKHIRGVYPFMRVD